MNVEYCQLLNKVSCILFHLLIANRNQNRLAETEQTPRNPHVSQPKTAVVSDV